MAPYPLDLKRVALYLRKSRADQEAELHGEGETLSKHRRSLFEMAKKYRYAIEDVYEEVVSGERIVDRPEMQKMLHAVRDESYTAVLCMDVDRLGRGNMIDQGMIQEAFKSSDTLIITPRKVYDLRDEMDEEWSEFESFMARRELKIITRRMQRGRKQSAAEGKSISKKPPYGYLRDTNNKLYPDPETAPYVKMIFELYASGVGITKISHRFEDMGVPYPLNDRGTESWDKSTVRDIINNEVYLGRIIWGQYSRQKKDGSIKKKLLPRNEWTIAENAHIQIIDQELWDKAHNAPQTATHTKKNQSLKNALAGILRCSECGKVMLRRKSKGRPNANMKCNTYKCPTRSSLYESIEQKILEQLRVLVKELPSKDHSQKPRQKSDAIRALEKKRSNVHRELEELKKQRENLHTFLERGVYDIETFLERNRVVSEQMETADKTLVSTEQELTSIWQEQEHRDSVLPAIGKVVEEYEQTKDSTQKNRLLKAVVKEVRYSRRNDDEFTLDIYLRF